MKEKTSITSCNFISFLFSFLEVLRKCEELKGVERRHCSEDRRKTYENETTVNQTKKFILYCMYLFIYSKEKKTKIINCNI